jgi:hypothetical protein
VEALDVTRAGDSGFEIGTSLDVIITATGYNGFGELETFTALDLPRFGGRIMARGRSVV